MFLDVICPSVIRVLRLHRPYNFMVGICTGEMATSMCLTQWGAGKCPRYSAIPQQLRQMGMALVLKISVAQ